MNCHFPLEGNRATVIIGLSNPFDRRGNGGSNLGVTKLISLEVEVGFSTQSMNEESGRSSADGDKNRGTRVPDHLMKRNAP